MADTAKPARSGCALAAGILLIITGTLLLAHNLFGFALLAFWTRAAVWFAQYWPILLILWGIYKIYQRFAVPERARVSGGEIVLIVLIIVGGLTLRASRLVVEQIASELTWDEMVGLLGPDLLGPAHRVVERRSFDLPLGSELLVENELGSVSVLGWEEPRIEVTLTKRVHHFSEGEARRIADDVSLAFEPGDGRARLRTTAREGGSRVETELELRIPAAVALSVRNGRGAVRLSNFEAPVEVKTSYGAVEAENLRGGVKAETSHGAVHVARLSGRTELRNLHGSITVQAVDGDLVAETRNGSILAEDVTGAARARNRHASVRLARIGDNVEVAAHHAEVSIESAGGSVAVATSHEPVFIRDVEGNVTIDARDATIVVRDVQGDVAVENLYRPITLAAVEGGAAIDGRQCAVYVDGVRGPVTVAGSHERIEVLDFRSGLNVQARHAPVSVATDELAGAVRLETTYGDVDVRLPLDASARIEASARDGELRSDFPELELAGRDTDRGRTWRGQLGSGRVPVSVATSYGDILLRSTQP